METDEIAAGEVALDQGWSMDDTTATEREALEWVVRMTSGEATESDRLAFRNWRARSPENEAALVAARSLWIRVGWGMPQPRKSAIKPLSRWKVPRLAIAASVLLCAFLGFKAYDTWRFDEASGSQRRAVALSDGTQVELNTDSGLSVDFSKGARRVVLGRGEAFFDVTHDASRPFIVKAGDGQVRVLGTAFSVRQDDGGVLVTVARGRVEVDDGASPVVLTPGMQVRYGGGHHGEVANVDVYNALGWRRGRLIIESQPLDEIVTELNRYYPGHIFLRAGETGRRKLNAVIDLEHIDDWLAALEGSQPLEVSRFGPIAVIH